MRLSDFNYNLPPELIAQHPLPDRTASRLLVLGNESHGQTALADQQFTDVVDLIQSNDLLVFNDTKVIPARLFGKKDSGGAVEVLEGEWSPTRVVVLKFPDMDAGRRFYNSPEYVAARQARAGASHMRMILVDGL